MQHACEIIVEFCKTLHHSCHIAIAFDCLFSCITAEAAVRTLDVLSAAESVSFQEHNIIL